MSSEDLAKVRDLQKQGVNVSELMRDAIRAEHQRRAPRRYTKRQVDAILGEIHSKYPDPKDRPPKSVNPHDRRAFREMIRNKVRGNRRA